MAPSKEQSMFELVKEISPSMPLASRSKSMRANLSKHWPWIGVAIVIVFITAIRIRLLQIPLERDEGEFAYMGQLMVQGIPPYLLAYNMKLPGIYAAYALIMAIFGQTIAGIHIGLMVANAIAILLLFLLTRRLFDDVAGVVAAACYALTSLSPSVLGTSAHATQFIVPLVLGGTFLLVQALDSRKYSTLFVSGLLFGLALMMKQHAVLFIGFGVIYLLWSISRNHPFDLKRLVKGISLFILASAIPFIVSCVILYGVGVFPRFWFWTFTYASQYVSEVTLSTGMRHFMMSAQWAISPWVWAVSGVGLTAIFWNEKARANWFFLIGFSLFSFLSVCPGFFFRSHYFVTLLPAVALLAGVAASAMKQFLSDKKMPLLVQILPLLIVAGAVVGPMSIFTRFFFTATPVEACRMMYGENPFPESIEIGEYIKNHSTEDDKIAVIGSEPQIYFYANRKSATGYIYIYGLMEPQDYASRMQREMIHEIEKARPKYIVFVNVPYSWLVRQNSDMTLLKWAQRYLDLDYRIVGLADINPNGISKVYWNDESTKNGPRSPFNVYVLERRAG